MPELLMCDEYVRAIGVGEMVSRSDMARLFGVHYQTAKYHLERAVLRGTLNAYYGWIDSRAGWLYALPETMPRLPLEGI